MSMGGPQQKQARFGAGLTRRVRERHRCERAIETRLCSKIGSRWQENPSGSIDGGGAAENSNTYHVVKRPLSASHPSFLASFRAIGRRSSWHGFRLERDWAHRLAHRGRAPMTGLLYNLAPSRHFLLRTNETDAASETPSEVED